MSECLGVPNKTNSSKDIFYARSNDGAAMVEKTKLECDLGGFECDASDGVLGSIDESVFVGEVSYNSRNDVTQTIGSKIQN